MNNIYGVSFKNEGKVYYFDAYELTCPLNVTVIVKTERGLQFGKVVSEINQETIEKAKIDINTLCPIIRISTRSDYNQYLNNLKEAKDAINFANQNIEKLKLKMKIIESDFTFDRKQLLFTFVADSRIDFRELAKELAGKYKTRIELHQVGARDKAKTVGGIGMCGHELCCKRFLNKIQAVTMNMAKDQNIALNPNKINGCCGRLLCCLAYEDDDYQQAMHGMPNVGQMIKTKLGIGYVISIDILNRKYKVNINNDIKEIGLDDESSKE